ncbi:heme ABC transporter ATP-binding protein [Motilimonas eburnea]|uniref:heme ABC transporter ATP-binding protein n=1 Tax=Motilimonas eburnea TaxID=1737488 RepID=UPI001E59C266|nr:heme ABC transporter ATP-binding protein [Motilimonas eburnea]MCE2573313.1 heme ABC transporter ATP-binding protein [Motilimonas eburnea]
MLNLFTSSYDTKLNFAALHTPSASPLQVSDLSYTTAKQTLVDQVSFSLKAGELTVILGPNGAGKSSLLKLISGELSQGGHNIRIFGQPRDIWPDHLLAQHMAILPQSSQLSFAFSAREVVALGGLSLPLKQSEVQYLTQENMAATDVLHLADRAYPSLSGGEKQRVHLARVLTQLSCANQHGILLLDEPTSALDLAQQHKVLSLCRQMSQKGMSVLMVLHDLNLAAQYADRLLLMQGGKLALDGSPNTVISTANIAQIYGHKVSIKSHPIHHYPVIMSA